MKVLYDTTILGRAHADNINRTGVFRVVERIAEELVRQPECELTLCTNSEWKDVILSINYLASNPLLSNVPFLTPVNYKLRKRLLDNENRLPYQDPKKWEQTPFVFRTGVRIQNKLLKIAERMLSRSSSHMLRSSQLKDLDIYHTNFFAYFDGIKEAGIKKCFITIYDLIPVLYPQYCDAGVPEIMRSILDKLTPDTWVPVISEATRNDLLNFMGSRIDPNKVVVTELAASDMFYRSEDKLLNRSVRKKYGIPDDPYVLSVCTLEPRKNIDQAIKAFVQILKQEKIYGLNLVLVGAKGWKSEKILESIDASAAIKSRIYITGYMADEDLAPIYSDALMFVYPSFYEGFGLPPLEAMQCGVPVITSNNSSLPEVVGNAGIMIDPNDTSAICAAMWDVYSKPALQQQLVENGISRAKQFSWRKCAEKTVAAYRKAMEA